jgi:hypothetical protein
MRLTDDCARRIHLACLVSESGKRGFNQRSHAGNLVNREAAAPSKRGFTVTKERWSHHPAPPPCRHS